MMQGVLSEFDESPDLAYDAALRTQEECRVRITALLERREEMPSWLVAALEAILEEVL